MNTKTPVVAFYLCLVLSAVGAITTESESKQEFDRAQRNYEAATKQALQPVRKQYVDTLNELLKRATAANDLNTALKIKQTLEKLAPATVDNRLVGTRWTFPTTGRPNEEKWIEFRTEGLLEVGWDSSLRGWSPLSRGRVVIHPYTNTKFSFVIQFDAKLKSGAIQEGEFKGQTIQRLK